MRAMISVLILGLLSTIIVVPVNAQKKDKMSNSQLKTMTWTTKSEEAHKIASEGVDHFMNIEFPQAYESLKKAVELDPDFTVALVFLANLTQGETKKGYAKRAIAS